jgi:hypothetical protein
MKKSKTPLLGNLESTDKDITELSEVASLTETKKPRVVIFLFRQGKKIGRGDWI